MILLSFVFKFFFLFHHFDFFLQYLKVSNLSQSYNGHLHDNISHKFIEDSGTKQLWISLPEISHLL